MAFERAVDYATYANFSINITHPAHKALKYAAVDLGVTPSRLVRDIVALWLGYTYGRDPRFTNEHLGGDLPAILDTPPGYASRIDYFRSPAKAMPAHDDGAHA